MMQHIAGFLRSFDFYKSTVLTFSILAIVLISVYTDKLDMGMSVIIGVFACAPADIPGSRRHMLVGVLFAIVSIMVTTFLLGLAMLSIYTLLPALVCIVFAVSMISVYGFRASLVSLGALLAIVFAFAHRKAGIPELIEHVALLGMGGVLYLGFSQLMYQFTHRGHITVLLAECMRLTAAYLDIKGRVTMEGDKGGIRTKELLDLQVKINEKHEILRDILLTHRTSFGHSSFAKKQMLVFIELVDIHELSVAHLASSEDIPWMLSQRPEQFNTLINLTNKMKDWLENQADELQQKGKAEYQLDIDQLLEQAKQELDNAYTTKDIHLKDIYLSLKNIYDFIYKVADSLHVIERVLNNIYDRQQVWLRGQYASKFITQQDYDIKTLVENLSLRSPIFKHSLRLSVTMLVGYLVGTWFPLQNSYWILLTIIVIMRPGYSLTKERSRQRIIGTFIGASVAYGLVLVSQHTLYYSVLATVSFLFAFALLQKNYKYAAVFITLSIIFIYALIQPDVVSVIKFRVIDTLVGAMLAITANAFLWPAWEVLGIEVYIAEALKANRAYVLQIDKYYHDKDNIDPSYKLSRKNAFLATGNLNAAFQRMAQEPHTSKTALTDIYELVSLNHNFLSLSAALGTYIHHHPTTAASRHFEAYITGISNFLKMAEHMEVEEQNHTLLKEVVDAQKSFEKRYSQLLNAKQQHTDSAEEVQELKLVSEQLKAMFSIAENILQVRKRMQELRILASDNFIT